MSDDQRPDVPPSPMNYVDVGAPPRVDLETSPELVENELYEGITRRNNSTHLSHSESQYRRIAHMFEGGSHKVKLTCESVKSHML